MMDEEFARKYVEVSNNWMVCPYCKKKIRWWQKSIRPSDWYHEKCMFKKYGVEK